MTNASYAARQPPAVEREKPVHVLVTGFGNDYHSVRVAFNTHNLKESHDQFADYIQPFLDRFPKNSSWEIASTLPALIPASSGNPTPIHIHVHHEPIRVAYKNVVDIVPKLLTTTPKPDVVLHIGLAASRRFFAIEQGAHSRGYGKTNDVDGELFPDSEAEKVFPDSQYPSVLHTGFDTEDVVSRWRTSLGYTTPDGSPAIEQLPDVRINPDAGNFLCGFIYYNSLAWCHSKNPKPPSSETNGDASNGGDASSGAKESPSVIFMHVPDLTSSESKLHEGCEVTVALIKALVESRRKVGVGRESKQTGSVVQEDDARNNKVG
ncbi:hypothetical protein N0V91_000385 [Didymella pomorum]|uniref:Peptidase C15, pyroglutamyl peptidase I-like protein n=1 Tax=Didymella pomorum TaxID=749634 RepID=A0A9W8ZNE8_9PLEO|nr:hypothetical protein N0V91_000385 [Didymella pomorum]